MERSRAQFVPESVVAASAATAMTLVYSAPTPGTGSRYLDGRVAHESRVLSVVPVRDAIAGSNSRGVGETVLEAPLFALPGWLRRSARRRVPGPAGPRRPAW